jgi:hypothetical protein
MQFNWRSEYRDMDEYNGNKQVSQLYSIRIDTMGTNRPDPSSKHTVYDSGLTYGNGNMSSAEKGSVVQLLSE